MIPKKSFEDAIDFYGNSLVADEPICTSLDMPFDDGYRGLIRHILEENLSIALLSSRTGEMIAGRFLNIASCNEKNLTGMYSMSDALKKLYHDVASGSEITPCNKIGKPLAVYRFTGNFMTSIITLRKKWQNLDVFVPKILFLISYNVRCHVINRI